MANKFQAEMGRLPIKPLPFNNSSLIDAGELMIDFIPREDGTEPTYHIFIADAKNRRKIIDLSSKLIQEGFSGSEPFANTLRVDIELEGKPMILKEVLNFMYKRFVFANDPTGFDYHRDKDLIQSKNNVPVLLQNREGSIIMPITSISSVYDPTGKTLEERLNSVSTTTTLARNIKLKEDTTDLEIEYPFAGYISSGTNSIIVYLNGLLVSRFDYKIINEENNPRANKGHIIFLNIQPKKDDIIDIIFLYNTSVPSGGDFEQISGRSIDHQSIPYDKLEKISTDYTTNDETSIATAASVFNLYKKLSEDMAAISGTYFYCADISSNLEVISIKINAEVNDIKDNTIFKIFFPSAKTYVNQININNKPFQLVPKISVNKSNSVIEFVYSNEKIYPVVTSKSIHTNRYTYNTQDNEQRISYSGLVVNSSEQVYVYRNGVRQFEDIDYYIDRVTKEIRLYIKTKLNERFVFETQYLA